MNNLLKISNLKHRFLRKKKIFKGVIGTILIYFYMNKCIIRFTVNVATLYNTSWSARRCQLEKKLYFEEKNVEICFAYDTPGRSTQGFSEKISAHSVQPFGLS